MSKATALLIGFLIAISLGMAQQPSVLNEDGTVNSALNRAARGETVQLLLISACPKRGDSSHHESTTRESTKPKPAQASEDTAEPRVIMNVQAAEVLSSSGSHEYPGLWKVIARVPVPSEDQEPLHDETPYIVFLNGSTESLGNLWVEP